MKAWVVSKHVLLAVVVMCLVAPGAGIAAEECIATDEFGYPDSILLAQVTGDCSPEGTEEKLRAILEQLTVSEKLLLLNAQLGLSQACQLVSVVSRYNTWRENDGWLAGAPASPESILQRHDCVWSEFPGWLEDIDETIGDPAYEIFRAYLSRDLKLLEQAAKDSESFPELHDVVQESLQRVRKANKRIETYRPRTPL